ncbi:hypothetical protein [Acidithiobacillus sp.]|uniref:hypothetical protein n=1 Tax=Acidithiobacillus sp. TaxID=1872118 RepID=UPI0025861427|nr:hypothetical protein [Acidithiobacillus sp.]MDD5374431.1 hypothetical protein [Acidithiobacillus sp.]
MNVGELIKKLQKYEDETEVLVQSPDDQFVWNLMNVGEDEYEHVYILAGTVHSRWIAPPHATLDSSKAEDT